MPISSTILESSRRWRAWRRRTKALLSSTIVAGIAALALLIALRILPSDDPLPTQFPNIGFRLRFPPELGVADFSARGSHNDIGISGYPKAGRTPSLFGATMHFTMTPGWGGALPEPRVTQPILENLSRGILTLDDFADPVARRADHDKWWPRLQAATWILHPDGTATTTFWGWNPRWFALATLATLPLQLITVALLWLTLIAQLIKTRCATRLSSGLCPDCAHPFINTPASPMHCPECGWQATQSNQAATATP